MSTTRSRGYSPARKLPAPLAVICVGAFVSFAIFGLAGSRAEAVDLPTTLTISICGDAITNAGEVCDLGIANNTGDYSNTLAGRQCTVDCSAFAPYCGDGILQVRFGEECDDGNDADFDLCSPTCQALTPDTPGGGGSGLPPRGNTPQLPRAPGTIDSSTLTRVILRGKAYPNRPVTVLLDGQVRATVQADANADFQYSSTNVTPGAATFGFWAEDLEGNTSITTTAVFEVVQSAVTTVANIFIPPTIAVSEKQVQPGELLTLSGQSVPTARILTTYDTASSSLASSVDTTGTWALQLDTSSLPEGFHTAKALFELTETIKSGFGKSVSFYVGEGTPVEAGSADINGDGRVNLVDFSIFLLSWGTDAVQADFNSDGIVNLADFSIMLFGWTG